MSPEYRYIDIGADGDKDQIYIYHKQNPISLARMLYLTDLKRLRRLGYGKRSIVRLLRGQMSLRRIGSDLILPVFGNLCIRCHNGYLTFDLERREVAKVFDEKVDDFDVEREIEAMKYVSQLDFAPVIRRWSTDERWYIMDYINSEEGNIISADGSNFFEAYREHVERCIEKMILLKQPVTITAKDYLKSVIDSALNDGKSEMIPNRIKDFLILIADKASCEGRNVYLIFSHGDFGAHNFLMSKRGITVIDWEEAAFRTVLYDLYNLIFTMRHNENFPHAYNINETVRSLQDRLASRAPEIASSIEDSKDLYRRIFYVEKVRRLMQRELTPRRLEDISNSVDAFSRGEESLVANKSVFNG